MSLRNYGLKKTMDSFWLKQDTDKLQKEQAYILSILLGMVDAVVLMFMLSPTGFTITDELILYIFLLFVVNVFMFYQGVIFVKKWSKNNLGNYVMYGHCTKKGYERTLSNLESLFDELKFDIDRVDDVWDGYSKLFKTKNNETVLKIRFTEGIEKNLFISIFNSKEFPEMKEILKKFFKEYLFMDKDGNKYLRMKEEVKMDIIHDAKKLSIDNELDFLKSKAKIPVVYYIYFGFGFAFYFMIQWALIDSPPSSSEIYWAIQLVLTLFFLMNLSVVMYIYKDVREAKERLRELKVLDELYK